MNIYVKLQINYLTLKIKICLKKYKCKFVKHLYIHYQIIVTVSLQKNSYYNVINHPYDLQCPYCLKNRRFYINKIVRFADQ